MAALDEAKPDGRIRFLLNGERVEVPGLAATTTVLEYLREHAGLTGTKEGCAEGDCGACTVLMATWSGDEAPLAFRSINSCIRLLPTIDGCELLTVEGLADGDRLHPVQQAMVDHHGSQCGFCTPGFVMSLAGLYLQTPDPHREQVLRAIAGNLCRCTGYRPIIEAGLAMGSMPEPAGWRRQGVDTTDRRAALRALQREQTLTLPDYVAPRSMDELAKIRLAEPEARLLAGGTDLGLEVTKALKSMPMLIHVGAVPELLHIESTPGGLRIGAAVPLSDAWTSIVEHFPGFAEVAERFASPPVCHSGTLGGNVANGSPIGDGMPVLLAVDARLHLRRGDDSRVLPLYEFYSGYRQTALQEGEFLCAIEIPWPQADWRFAGYKLGKRWDQDISAVCAGFGLAIANGHIEGARLGFGGMAAIPARARAAEAALTGVALDAEAFEVAAAALAEDFAPIDDFRASADYRLQGAGNLLRRFGRSLLAGGERIAVREVVG